MIIKDMNDTAMADSNRLGNSFDGRGHEGDLEAAKEKLMMATFAEEEDDEDEGDDQDDDDSVYEEVDSRFLEVCIDGDVEDLVGLMEDMARAGETLGPDMLNCVDSTGRVG